MALKATIFKAQLDVSDMDRNYYGSHALTIARHPSETDERMMVRVLAYALNASETLQFSRGISADDEPDIWDRDLTGAILRWIEIGQPDGKRVRKACGKADSVAVYTFGAQASQPWWQQWASDFAKLRNVSVYRVPTEHVRALARLADRTMQIACTIQDGNIWVSSGETTIELALETLQEPQPR
jgi:uncharacterized protein YaeQ